MNDVKNTQGSFNLQPDFLLINYIRWLQRDINKSNIFFFKFEFEFDLEFEFEFEFEFQFEFQFEFEFEFEF